MKSFPGKTTGYPSKILIFENLKELLTFKSRNKAKKDHQNSGRNHSKYHLELPENVNKE